MRATGRTPLILGGVLVLSCAATTVWAPPPQPVVRVVEFDRVTDVMTNDTNYLYVLVQGNLKSGITDLPDCGNMVHPSDTAPFGSGRSKYELSDERTQALMRVAIASLLSRRKIRMVATADCDASHRIIAGASIRGGD